MQIKLCHCSCYFYQLNINCHCISSKFKFQSCYYFSCTKYWPGRRLALPVEILASKVCPSAVVPALQSIWFYNTQSDVWYEHNFTKRSGNNKPSSLIIRCVVSCIRTLRLYASMPLFDSKVKKELSQQSANSMLAEKWADS